ncbi:MAG TPA: hypothetical protein VFD53_10595, partial [Ilumatobacter sp.]|nr:hypothetical protein [Ilumatobacter sp.]
AQPGQVDMAAFEVVAQAAGGSDDDMAAEGERAALLARIHAAEHHLLVAAIKGLIAPTAPDASPPDGSHAESPADNDEFPDDTKATST